MTLSATAEPPDLRGIFNFRDFGGQPTEDGRQIRRGRLYRSGHHASATDEDLEQLSRLGLAVVLDLRRPGERQRDPSRRPHGAQAEILEHAGAADEGLAPHLAFLNHPEATPAYIDEFMIRGYRTYPFHPAYTRLYGGWFERLARIDGAALVHCHAGKDRTGVLCALTLDLLGAPRELIYEDYLLTNAHNREDERLRPLMADFERDHGRPVSEALLRHVLRADARYLDAAFDEMKQRHGSVAGYLEAELGVTSDRREQIRRRLLT